MQFGIQIEPQFGFTFEDVLAIARDKGQPVGTPDQVADALRAYAKLGVTYLIPVFPFGYDRECLRVFAKQVAPALD